MTNEEWLKNQCNRYINGVCMTRRCLIRGGYKRGVTVDYECLTCYANDVLNELKSLREKLKQVEGLEKP